VAHSGLRLVAFLVLLWLQEHDLLRHECSAVALVLLLA
jgi:hypothetical protein